MVATPPSGHPVHRFWALSWKVKLLVLIGLPIVLFLGGTVLLNEFNYSVGTRTGVLDKLSSKGVACWTTEGQLAMAAFSRPGTLRSQAESIDNTFYFSVPDRDIKTQLDAIPPGSPVTLEYRQKLFALDWPIPFFCVRRTQYEIVGVRSAPSSPQDSQAPGRPPVPRP